MAILLVAASRAVADALQDAMGRAGIEEMRSAFG
jgi:hypothetical protein